MRTIWTSTLLIAIGILTILTIIPINHMVTGFSIVLTVILTGGYFAFFILTTIFSFKKNKRENRKNNFGPIIITIFFSFLIPFIFIKEYELFKAPTILEAFRHVKGHQGVAACLLVLRKDNTYKAELIHLEASGVYKGDYTIKNDTLILTNDIVMETDGVFSDKYFMDKANSILYPISGKMILQDTSLYLEITKKYE